MSATRGRRLPLLGALFVAAVPVAFALIRLFSTGTDSRYLWMAAAAFVGAAAAARLAPTPPDPSRVSLAGLLSGITAGTVCAATAGVIQGATAVAGIVLVSVPFGICAGAAIALARHSRPPSR
jgi:hypothetical protein